MKKKCELGHKVRKVEGKQPLSILPDGKTDRALWAPQERWLAHLSPCLTPIISEIMCNFLHFFLSFLLAMSNLLYFTTALKVCITISQKKIRSFA